MRCVMWDCQRLVGVGYQLVLALPETTEIPKLMSYNVCPKTCDLEHIRCEMWKILMVTSCQLLPASDSTHSWPKHKPHGTTASRTAS